MRGDSPGGDVVERAAFVEERRLRRVEIFRRRILFERPAPEGDERITQIRDRKHHTLAEAIIRKWNVLTGDEQSRLYHGLGCHTELAQMLLEREALIRRVAQAKF